MIFLLFRLRSILVLFPLTWPKCIPEENQLYQCNRYICYHGTETEITGMMASIF